MTDHLAKYPVPPASSEAMLEALQRDAFGYFLRETNPANGLVVDKTQPGAPASIAAVGFATVARAGGAIADAGPFGAVAGTALGYLGGGRLGLSLLPVALPAALLTGLALLAVVRGRVWRDVGDGAGALAVVTVAMVATSTAIVVATGMVKPRTFLFLAPFLCALTVLYGPLTSPRWRSVGTLLAVAPTLLLLTQLRATEWPFKRNHARAGAKEW